jgi:hypothetical protein
LKVRRHLNATQARLSINDERQFTVLSFKFSASGMCFKLSSTENRKL